MKIRHVIASSALVLAGAADMYAHRVWVLPAVTVLSGTDQWVSFEAAVSNNLFFPNHRPVGLAQIEVIGPDGKPVEIQNATAGQIRSSFELHLQQQGTYVVSLRPGQGRAPQQASAAPTAGAAAPQYPAGPGGAMRGGLNGTYEEDGKTVRWRGTPETLVSEGVAAKPGFKLRESGGRKVVTYVTLGKPTDEVLAPTGTGLEVDFVTHPNDLFAGEPAEFRFLLEGKPAAGAEVTVVRGDDRYRDEAGDVNLRADADGVVKIAWPQPGRYWLEATASTAGTLHGMPSEKSFTYIATFEVLPD
ncbi:DUF4198 domain-containing protein [Opitutales bacterium ASA1]|uniref:DUF4198 domain-containing protein n=1 Tax=Congregicoccus parvus TaxID=3081749 RepID=UPI002B2BF62D|nr:DUF4198 domain-containing protein [Opitutales bacterium ASA1]